MARDFFTDEQVEIEIERLLNSEEVRLAKKEAQIKNRRRQYMWSLRTMEKRGKELAKMGMTVDNIGELLFGEIEEEA
jgi:hypothetical protein